MKERNCGNCKNRRFRIGEKDSAIYTCSKGKNVNENGPCSEEVNLRQKSDIFIFSEKIRKFLQVIK